MFKFVNKINSSQFPDRSRVLSDDSNRQEIYDCKEQCNNCIELCRVCPVVYNIISFLVESLLRSLLSSIELILRLYSRALSSDFVLSNILSNPLNR